jgi:TolB-like protein/Tfp pilus assembly protein PilF
MSFLGEIRRRKVFQVAAVYAVVAWLIIQIIDVVGEPLSLPDSLDTVVIVLLAVGFPIAVILAWAFEVTPGGVVRDKGGAVAVRSRGRRIEYVLAGLLLVATGWIGFLEFNPLASSVLPNSIAVLPCDNFSPSPDNAFFAPGIHTEIINQLVKIQALNVIPRASVLQYEDVARPISEIAHELNVAAVMECSVSYAEGRVSVSAQVTNAETGISMWTESYNRELVGVFGIQADIAKSIANALEAEFSDEERTRLEEIPTDSIEAWTRYLQAMALMGVGLNPNETAETMARFHALLDQAIALDPNFARAHAVKAVGYAFSMIIPLPVSDPRTVADWERLANESAQRALRIDPETGLAHMALALAHQFSRRGTAALQEFEAALTLNPNDIDILDDFARLNVRIGRPDEAVRQMQRVQVLNPSHSIGWMLLLAGNLDESAAAFYDAFAIRAPNADSATNLALVEAIRGNAATARDYLKLGEAIGLAGAGELIQAGVMAQRAYIYGRIGDAQDALKQFDELETFATRYRVGETRLALAYLGTGNRFQALEHLNAAAASPYDDGWFGLVALNIYHDEILEEPEFVEVRRRLGFRE